MKNCCMFIEPLEDRIAPAAFGFTDVDGDKGLITISGGTSSFTSSSVGVPNGVQINQINITSGSHINVTVKVTQKGAHGDGLINVGRIVASMGVTLGTVTVPGDLGQIIVVGTGTLTDPVVKALNVNSMGEFGTATGATMNGNNTVQSVIAGTVGSLNVKHDVQGSLLQVLGNLGAVNIGGSLVGEGTANSGELFTGLALGAVKIGGSVMGGSATDTGVIQSNGGIKSVTVSKSVTGSFGSESGYILNNSSKLMGAVKIGGSLESGTNTFSGTVNSFGPIASVSIGKSIIGGDDDSGLVIMQSASGSIGPVKIGQNVIGGNNSSFSGSIISSGTMGAVTIVGSLTGGGNATHTDSGAVEAGGNLGAVKIGGDLQRGLGLRNGFIESGAAIAGVSVKGWDSGSIQSVGNIGALNMGSYFSGGFESTAGSVKSVSVTGDLTGDNFSTAAGNIGSIFVGGSVTNATGITSTGGAIASLVVKGAVESGSGFQSQLNFGLAKIGGDFDGTIASNGGNVGAVSIAGEVVQGVIAASKGSIGSVTVGGDFTSGFIIAGQLASNTTDVKIGSVSVKGDWIASSLSAGFKDTNNNGFGNNDDALVSKTGTVGSIVIGGQVIGTPVSTTDHFGFDAQSITTFKTGENSLKVGDVVANILLSTLTNDVDIHVAHS